MGGGVSAAANVVKKAVTDVVKQPLKGTAELATATVSAPAAAIGSTAGATKGIPVIGTLTQGSQSVSDALARVSSGSAPTGTQLKSIGAAGVTVAGGFVGGAPGVIIGDTLGQSALGGGNFKDALSGAVKDLTGYDPTPFLDYFSPTPSASDYAQSVVSSGGGDSESLPGNYSGSKISLLVPILATAGILAAIYLGKR